MQDNASLDATEQQYLTQLNQEYKQDLQQIRRNATMRWWFQFLRFWAAFFFVVEIAYVVWQAISGAYAKGSVFSIDTLALIALAILFGAVFFICDHYIA